MLPGIAEIALPEEEQYSSVNEGTTERREE